MNRPVKKLLAVTALSGILSVSALALTAQAAGRMTACCSQPKMRDYLERHYVYEDDNKHAAWEERGIKCENCGTKEVYYDQFDFYEEHDYDIYDLQNRKRFCVCGDYFSW